MPSEYEKRIREEELRRLAEEYDWLQQNQERGEIDVEELKRQKDMEDRDFLQDPEAPYDFNQAMQIGGSLAEQDAQKNKVFDEAIDSVSPEGRYQRPPLENLREGVRIRQKEQNLNPINTLGSLVDTWDDQRTTALEGAQRTVTNLTGNETLGGVTRFAGEVLYPEAWEVPLIGAAAAIPVDGPLGEAAIYGTGALNRLRRGLKGVKASTLAKAGFSAKALRKTIFGAKINPGGRYGDEALELAGIGKLDIGDVDDFTSAKPLQMTGSGGGNSIQGTLPLSSSYSLTESLRRNEGLTRFLTGKSSRLGNRDIAGLLQDKNFTRLDFYDQQELIKNSLNKLYPNYKGPKVEDRVQKLLWSFHHENPLKYGPDLYKGKQIGLPKTDPASTDWVTDILEKKGVGSGWNPTNRQVLTPQQHWITHDWLGKRLGERGDVLKVKWAERFGVRLTGSTSAKDVMGNYVHQALSSADRQLFNEAYAAADPKLQKAYISAWADTIIESRKIMKDLRDQLDILFRVPDGYKLQLGDKDWHNILDGMPTRDGKTILPEMKAHIEFMIKEGAIDQPLKVINPKGVVVETIDTSSMEWKEMQSLTELLKDTKLTKYMRNKYKKERQRLHNKLYQTGLDLKGAEKTRIKETRLEQERLRREGK